MLSAVAGSVLGASGGAAVANLTGSSGAEDEGSKVERALKEALSVGMQRTVEQLSRENGYYSDQTIRIPMPSNLNKVAKIAAKLGMSRQLDQFILSMNRAAERAAVSAIRVFAHFITTLRFADVRTILHGSDSAATDFFKARSKDELTEAYKPIVRDAMHQCDVTKHYQSVARAVEKVHTRARSYEEAARRHLTCATRVRCSSRYRCYKTMQLILKATRSRRHSMACSTYWHTRSNRFGATRPLASRTCCRRSLVGCEVRHGRDTSYYRIGGDTTSIHCPI